MDVTIKPIRSTIALLTNQCNLACPYCFEKRDVQMMSLDTAKKLVDFVAPQQGHITLFGGEPTLMWDSIIVPLTDYAQEKGVSLGMTTNGTLLTPERVDFLIDHHVNFMLSMDGGKETQDNNRPMKGGGSSFDAIPYEYILQKKPHQFFRSTLYPKTAEHLFGDIMFFESIGVKEYDALPDFFSFWSDASKNVVVDQIAKYEEYLIGSYRKGNKPLLMRAYVFAFSDICKLQVVQDRRTNRECLRENQCGVGLRGGCSCDVFGNLYACHHISPLTPDSSWCIGDIYNGVNTEKISHITEQYDPQLVGGDKCHTCPFDKICDGGCKSNNFMISGDLHAVPDMFCFWKRVIGDSAYRIAKKLGEENNETFVNDFIRWKGVVRALGE